MDKQAYRSLTKELKKLGYGGEYLDRKIGRKLVIRRPSKKRKGPFRPAVILTPKDRLRIRNTIREAYPTAVLGKPLDRREAVYLLR